MHLSSSLLLSGLAALSSATQYGVLKTDRFEDLGDGALAGNPPEVNSDGGVIYNRFGLAMGRLIAGTPQVSGVRTQSGTHYILTQRPAQGSIATSGRCVKLKELYVGCTSANVQGGVQKPLSCEVTMTAFDPQGKPVGVQKETYEPNNLLLADMMKITSALPAAANVLIEASVLDATGLGGVGPLVTGLYVDDTTYVQYDNDPAGKSACGLGFGT